MATTETAVSEEMQIQLVRGGDAGLFCELIRPYRRKLYLKTLSIVGNDADLHGATALPIAQRLDLVE